MRAPAKAGTYREGCGVFGSTAVSRSRWRECRRWRRAGGRRDEAAAPHAPADPGRPAPLDRLWPLGAASWRALGLAYALGLQRCLSFEALAAHRAALAAFVAARPVTAAAALCRWPMSLVVAFSLPGGAVMTLAGGFLFGPWLGAAAGGGRRDARRLRAVPRRPLRAGRDAGAPRRAAAGQAARGAASGTGSGTCSRCGCCRWCPSGCSTWPRPWPGCGCAPYAAATFLGIIPATAVFAGIGAGLGQVFDAGGRPDLSVIFSPGILLPLLGLAALSCWAWRLAGAARVAPGGMNRGLATHA